MHIKETIQLYMDTAEIILRHFPQLSETQKAQFAGLGPLYADWNSKINVVSRKDIDNLYLHHVLHSLAIAKYVTFKDDTSILDVGTGGGFPGIPLAILFPRCHFHLIDSIGKKIRVAMEVANAISLDNVSFAHENAAQERKMFDFVVSRAVMSADSLVRLIQKNVSRKGHNGIPNGLICLKGGDLQNELTAIHRWHEVVPLSAYFSEPYYETKKLIYIPL